MRILLLAACATMLLVGSAEARGSHAHYSYAGGHYGGHGSSHRGGRYVNRYTGNHYRHHTH
jgi:hypothetical protein